MLRNESMQSPALTRPPLDASPAFAQPMDVTTVITTVRHNIGDDFVREGLLFLLDSVDALRRVELVHKHSPVTATYGWESVRQLRWSRRIEPVLRTLHVRNRVGEADLLLQSGAPVYWCHPGGPHCADNEWFDPLIRKRFLPDRRGRRFISVAGGSCQRYGSDGSEIEQCPRCRAYIREFFDSCDLTLLRDDLARKMLNRAGRDADVLPCTSIFARDRMKIVPRKGEYIVLNFMESGGHYTFGQDIDAGRWRRQFVALAREAAKAGRVVIACHTPGEEKLAGELLPDVERFLVPNEHVAFMEFYAGAAWGVMNRVHGAFMMASLGKPAVVIGNDSRARMIENLGLPSHYVEDVEEVGVTRLIDEARSRCATYPEQIEAIRKDARTRYEGRIAAALSS
ncbi:MAG TPA: polysaccharide pyruvyl transferase family protein [Burkholderiales bacterium]|nr:polysaccharide pyruvyl transferase family protein [Burkholderiales bacterium]